MIRLREESVINYLGEPAYISGDELVYPCPECRKEGRDKDGDHLKYNTQKCIITCFADTNHSRKIFSEILKNAGDDYCEDEEILPEIVRHTLEIDEEYINGCARALKADITLQVLLESQRGLYGETLKLGIGFDRGKNDYVFPAYDIEYQLIGAELRPWSKLNGKVYKAKGTRSDLAFINQPAMNNPILVIAEGFIDAYTFWQYFYETGTHNEYQIATPINGVRSLVNLLHKIPAARYSRIIFCLDNDEAGRKAMEEIEKKAGFRCESWLTSCGCCKDFNEYYLNHKEEMYEQTIRTHRSY